MNAGPVIFVILQTGARANGGVQSITEIIGRLERHRPIVLTNVDNDFTRSWRADGIEVHVEPARTTSTLGRSPRRYFAMQLRYFRKLRNLVATTNSRVIHANDPLAFQLALAASIRTRAKLVLNLRGTMPPDVRQPRLKYRAIFALANRVLYLSHDMASRWRRVAPGATRACSVTYSIVDLDRFRFTRINADAPPAVIVSGLFWSTKGQLEFIRRAVPVLAENGVKTWFTGDFDQGRKPYGKACAEAAEQYGDAVQFFGFRNDMPEIISQARVVAIPSTHEGLSRSMLEAMSCGRPVVSFDVCSAREILEEEALGSGIVIKSSDFEAMANAILYYCLNHAAAAAAGAKGRAAATSLFSPDRVIRRYEHVYDALEAAK